MRGIGSALGSLGLCRFGSRGGVRVVSLELCGSAMIWVSRWSGLATSVLSHYTVPYDQVSFLILMLISLNEGVGAKQESVD